MAISSYSTVTDKFATLTKMQDENLNEKIERKIFRKNWFVC